MFACEPFGTHYSLDQPRTCRREFIREHDLQADENASNALTSSRMNSLPPGSRQAGLT
jgi:hypothetical protein